MRACFAFFRFRLLVFGKAPGRALAVFFKRRGRFVHRCGADDAAAQQRPDLERPAHAARVHEIRLRRPVRIRDAQHSDFELRRPHRPDAHALDVDFPPEALGGEAFDAPFGPSRLHRHHRRYQQHTQYADQDREHGNSAARGDFPVLHATGEALAVPMRVPDTQSVVLWRRGLSSYAAAMM